MAIDGLARQSLDLWPDAALVIDADGLVIEANDRLEVIFGYPIGGLVGQSVEMLLPDGAVRIANAGHLAPYRNGVEIDTPAELPLGIVSETNYQTVAVTLQRGERLTFLSDGVVEAENAKGELFGFDRSREISVGTAAEVADAAQAWGQNDDITVVTVERSS